ncbi:Cyclic di-GMP phosphodiesterase response regulator RpfG [Sporotomaculum syntrophicum]|uniref:Cyclic di-GMP phosphodiesterase response regulator RpfG n=1 Tax=Sporotomaculum syntrophicum TaxID=182264 RepID=A0A9D3AZ82_9FIRM|nr:diguanylate cyclase [Sporotomaculum syntrophicum]KAF1085619.1 Cyclic di-GMP phosphodiesterase response regulator RpfG [Sporotomaculum syntrophicum]
MITEEERQKELYEYITTTHMLCLLIFVIALILSGHNILPKYFYPFANIEFFFLFCLIGLIIVILYITKIRLTPVTSESLSYIDFTYMVLPLILSVSILFISHKDLSNSEAILLLPILITASVMGKKTGIFMASICSLFLILHEVILEPVGSTFKAIESVLIYISLMHVVGWFIGGITDMETKHRKHLTIMANTDMLTGLYNHRYFQEKLKEYFKSVSDKNPLSLIIIDIDYFKNYNDSFGHLEGDHVLGIIGDLLKKNIKSGIAARYGGEEFVVLLPHSDSSTAVQLAENIKKMVEEQKFYGEEYQPGGKITVSCGIATSPTHGINPKELIKYADYALYKAKSLNRNKVELYISVFEDLELNENEKESFNSIRTLISIINAKDRYTFGHSERVTDYSIKVAKRLQFSDTNIQLLKYASFLHDIGKIEIDGDILNKPGGLDENEWNVLKQHPRWGSDIVKSVSQLEPISKVILYHHENYDGSGYPEGIKAEDIPLLSRIIRIVDSYDAMTSNRVYKKNMTSIEVIEEIKRCSGTLYDPMLAQVFIDIIYSEESQQTHIIT